MHAQSWCHTAASFVWRSFIVGCIHHTVWDVGAAKPLDKGGESGTTSCESKRSSINGFVNLTSGLSKRLQGTGDSPRVSFWDGTPSRAPQNEAQELNPKRGESLTELMEDIEWLARLAYPDAAPVMLDILAKDQFIQSLTDEDMKLRIRQNHPESLQQTRARVLSVGKQATCNSSPFSKTRLWEWLYTVKATGKDQAFWSEF